MTDTGRASPPTARVVAVLDFLASHEPDLLAAAAALGVEPAELVSARKRL